MIQGGNATIYVSDMDRAVGFYTSTLGLKLQFRAGNHWAQVDAGKGLQIGLTPAVRTAHLRAKAVPSAWGSRSANPWTRW